MNETKLTTEPGKQEIWIEREFDAPRELVFKATTDADLIGKWWGPKEYKFEIDKANIRTNGNWRFIHGGTGFHGVYHEVSLERIIQTFEWEGLPEKGHVILETTRLEELPNNRTKLTIQQVFQTVADRDGMVASGQKKGMEESHQRLDELLKELTK